MKIFNVSLFFHLLGLLFDVVYYSRYSRDGLADENLLLASGTFYALADTTMMLLLISLAKGWTVVRRKVRVTSERSHVCTNIIHGACTLLTPSLRLLQISVTGRVKMAR